MPEANQLEMLLEDVRKHIEWSNNRQVAAANDGDMVGAEAWSNYVSALRFCEVRILSYLLPEEEWKREMQRSLKGSTDYLDKTNS